MLGHRAQLIAEHNEDHRSPKRSQEMMNPSENRHHHRIAGMLPIEVVRIDALDQKREQRPGKTNNRRRQHERAELVACGAVTEAANALPIVTYCLQDPAERRMDDAPNGTHSTENHCNHKEMIREIRAQDGSSDALKTIFSTGQIRPFESDLIE